MHQRSELRRKTLDLLAPVAQNGRWRDDEGWRHSTGLFPLLVLVRLPELEELLHFIAVQFHPLPAELDQGCFSVNELLPFLFRDYLAPNRQLVLVGDDRAESEIAMTGCSCPLGGTQSRFEADLRAPASLGCPPRRDDHGVTRVSEHPCTLLQEGERLVQSEVTPGRAVCGQPIPDRGIDPRGIPQGQQQIFLEVLAEGPGGFSAVLRLETPILLQAQLERGIVPGRDEKVQVPVIDIAGRRLL